MSAALAIFDKSIRVPADAHTLEGFRRWAISEDFPERGRVSFLDGEIDLDLSSEEIRSYIDPKTELSIVLGSLINRENLGKPLIDGTLLVNEAANVSNEPDFMLCSWETLKSGKVIQAETFPGCRRVLQLSGSPDLVVEIVSESSLRKDREILPERYWLASLNTGSSIAVELLRYSKSLPGLMADISLSSKRQMVGYGPVSLIALSGLNCLLTRLVIELTVWSSS